jgi:RimJ/RimL family protein N-acetyltransferase
VSRWRRRDAAAAGFPDPNAEADVAPAPDGAVPTEAPPAPSANPPAAPAGPATAAPLAEAAPAAPTRPPLTLPWPPLVRPDGGFSLRPWGGWPGDAAALAAGWADPEVARWTAVPADASERGARHWIVGDETRRDSGRALDLVISSLDDPQVVQGEVGLVLVEPARLWAEVGYWLRPEARGTGLAANAVQAFSDWVLSDLPVRRLFARIHPENVRAGRVAERAGYDSAGVLDDGTQVWVRDA